MGSNTDTELFLGFTPDGEKVSLPTSALLRHVMALGSSGAGKTVACKAIVEECIRKGIPAICVDPQGDLASLGLCEDVDKLIAMGVDPAIASEYHGKVEVKVWTPGSSHGIPVNISPSLHADGIERHEDKIRAFGSIATSLASIVGHKSEAAQVAFSSILEYADTHGLLIENIADFAQFLADPPLALAEHLDPIFNAKDRAKAEKAFRLKSMGSNRLLFNLGKAIHVDSLFGYDSGGAHDNGKVRISVIYLNTLNSQEEKEIFVAMLASALYQWMLVEAHSKPIGLFYIDEVAPFMPPVSKPASKQGLMLLLRQARKYGISCLLATQSPGDIDYKALGQTGTWLIGRLTTRQEREKVAPALRDACADGHSLVEGRTDAAVGNFVLVNADTYPEPVEFKVRWLASKHKTLGAGHVEAMTDDDDRAQYG
jgi:hypothetical protein